MLLYGMDYDELLQSNCYYTLSEEKDGVKYPCMFTAVVQYRKAGETFTKTVYLGIHYYNEEGSDDCNNGKDGNAALSDLWRDRRLQRRLYWIVL